MMLLIRDYYQCNLKYMIYMVKKRGWVELKDWFIKIIEGISVIEIIEVGFQGVERVSHTDLIIYRLFRIVIFALWFIQMIKEVKYWVGFKSSGV
jgi:hypothetical protein